MLFCYRYPSEIHEKTYMNPLAPFVTEIEFPCLSPASAESLNINRENSESYKQKKMIADFSDRLRQT